MMMMNCFCDVVDRRKVFSLISSWAHCQRSSPSRISHKPRAGFEPLQNLRSGFIEWSFAVVITTTPRCHCSITYFCKIYSYIYSYCNWWLIFHSFMYHVKNYHVQVNLWYLLRNCRQLSHLEVFCLIGALSKVLEKYLMQEF